MSVATRSEMTTDQAIEARRSVRAYTDSPVSPALVDEVIRLAFLAPSGSLADAWSVIVVREPERRRALAELVISGAEEYFTGVVAPPAGTDAGTHRAWAREFAERGMGLESYRQVPVWIVGVLVPRGIRPAPDRELDRIDDLISLGFAMENLFLAARSRGLGTVPTSFHRYCEREVRALLELPDELEAPILTPLGYPVEFPPGLPGPLKAFRHPPDALIRDETWAHPRRTPPVVPTVRALLGGA
jgi:coenzyme F420-0:L-glutamate ligase/coenzyme F420-1:gamma-L-glutamate ligase